MRLRNFHVSLLTLILCVKRAQSFLPASRPPKNSSSGKLRNNLVSVCAKKNNSSRSAPKSPPQPEFSRPVSLTELTRKSKSMEIEANETEMAAVAERFQLKSVNKLSAKVFIERFPGMASSNVVVKGKVDADVVQLCVATLLPFDTKISQEFRTVIRENSDESLDYNMYVPWDEDGNPLDGTDDWDEEVPYGGVIDVGEISAQYMALSIDFFGRIPGYVSGETNLSSRLN
mmetsp:Transcript_1303/g.1695  ORF Transcript_1303/g.1695 Transcript_1303/m.1695 type:complete len:230 (+) Transcript_1303:55-744(+)